MKKWFLMLCVLVTFPRSATPVAKELKEELVACADRLGMRDKSSKDLAIAQVIQQGNTPAEIVVSCTPSWVFSDYNPAV